ncbi:hypothetical protein V6C42_14845 [Pseudoclostridium thermosuccinogenes]|jgi:hypothetical protein|uniref:hypothetical protein n=1 Tax=Clostridium thermosuccinogenes TaxID=84032 RepID=UPI000CCC0505|nr:hypothetical protein [Pseudoclostridium thermosuccinogenes]PNT90894.1 hypothetical protein CDQ83_13715 [Pseudoclostridium thermosuccinogenes]
MTYIADDIVINVVQNVFTITFVIFSIYPVVYICRSMIGFVSKAFSNMNPDKAFKMPKINLGRKESE